MRRYDWSRYSEEFKSFTLMWGGIHGQKFDGIKMLDALRRSSVSWKRNCELIT